MSWGDEETDDSNVALPLASERRMVATCAVGEDSAVQLRPFEVAAVDVAAKTHDIVSQALQAAGIVMSGMESLTDAAFIIADAQPQSIREQLAQLRKRARPDAAVILVASRASPSLVREAHDAGALACLRAPVVAEELARIVRMTLDAQTTKTQLADLTRRLDLETHLASIGRMSAGLAHEIATPLMTARLRMHLIRERLARLGVDDADLNESVDAMAEAHARLDVVVDLMRKSMRKEQGVSCKSVDLAAIMEESRRLVAGELVGVETTLVGAATTAWAEPNLLAQILQNIITNAAQAAKTLPSPRIRLHTYLAGDRAVISVRDNGPGIAPEMHERIFEPFYTTRRAAGGTGLGLALCREYALRMGAELSLWSEPKRGACFRISMPLRP